MIREEQDEFLKDNKPTDIQRYKGLNAWWNWRNNRETATNRS